ncbi:MaoC family dehydratase N-terminal domain-containing protein [bacterium]|nr:MaoC family dehydratase N-terminal domain-containing protein [bacterium]
MAVNTDIIGKRVDGEPFAYTEDTAILYALGIGADINDLSFIYEKDLKVYPTFAVVPMLPALMATFETANLNLFAVLHGEQEIIMHQPLPPSATINTSSIVTSIYDKGDKGAVVNLETRHTDDHGILLFETRLSIMDRSGGNFGGERGPKAEKYDPPEEKSPDFEISYQTSKNQAALYRLSGDKNPLHIDPEFAKLGGFETPILHGLCTYGFAGRAIINSICEGDPSKLKSFGVRFKNVVFPGETLTTKGWKIEDKKYIVLTEGGDGRVVLGNGLVKTV